MAGRLLGVRPTTSERGIRADRQSRPRLARAHPRLRYARESLIEGGSSQCEETAVQGLL
jgi:hypothetical protein